MKEIKIGDKIIRMKEDKKEIEVSDESFALLSAMHDLTLAINGVKL